MGPVLAAMVLAGCGSADATGPPEINYGRDICIECGMSIDDARFAAAYRLEDGTEKRFDDLGGLIIHARDAGELEDATVWVHDFETEDWVDAPDAYYVPTLAMTSPMGHGILAFADRARAMQFAHDVGGEMLAWDKVVDLPVVEDLLGHHHEDEMDGMHDHEMDTNDQ